MSLKDRIRAAAERAASASQSAQETASDAEVNEEALQRARRRAAAAARRAGSAGATGSATPDVETGGSRTKEMFARAQEYATAGAPVDVDMDPSPNPEGMWGFAEAGNGGQPTSERPSGGEQEAGDQVDTGLLAEGWEDSMFAGLEDADRVSRDDEAVGVSTGDNADADEAWEIDDPFGAAAGFGGGE